MDEDYYTCRRCKHGSVGDCDKCEDSYNEIVTEAMEKKQVAGAELVAGTSQGESK